MMLQTTLEPPVARAYRENNWIVSTFIGQKVDATESAFI